ncbi:hypothetical protein [Micromonospora fulviviridis]|uniref:hypothetical protein n=1 Tax=Micromonospora fulviviridis TaxID=47860 RepID=UPI0037B76B5E
MALWLVLAFSLGRHATDYATYGHAVLVSFAALPAIARIQLSIAYARETRAALRHDEILKMADAVSSRTMEHSEAVSDTVDRLGAAIQGGTQVRNIR